jgi:hypothetical protein
MINCFQALLSTSTCAATLWRLAGEINVGSLKEIDLWNLFHVHLIHTELVGGDVHMDAVTFAPWMMREARDAWMRQVGRCSLTVSNPELKARLVSVISA